MWQDVSRNGPEPARSEVLESLCNLLLGVHDEWTVVNHRLADRLSTEKEHLEVMDAVWLASAAKVMVSPGRRRRADPCGSACARRLRCRRLRAHKQER